MKWDSKKKSIWKTQAFSLIEVTVAMVILGMLSTSVIVIVNRLMDTVIDRQMKMQAFTLARENMEKLLAQSSVGDMVEYGADETNPDITWDTTVESFYEPITNRMWMRAICSAAFLDSSGEEQTIELTHWLTSLSKKQVLKIIEQKNREKQYEQNLAQYGQETNTKNTDENSKTPQTNEEQANQNAQDDQWEQMNDLIGPPPQGYDNWGQVPDDIFWKTIMEKLF